MYTGCLNLCVGTVKLNELSFSCEKWDTTNLIHMHIGMPVKYRGMACTFRKRRETKCSIILWGLTIFSSKWHYLRTLLWIIILFSRTQLGLRLVALPWNYGNMVCLLPCLTRNRCLLPILWCKLFVLAGWTSTPSIRLSINYNNILGWFWNFWWAKNTYSSTSYVCQLSWSHFLV